MTTLQPRMLHARPLGACIPVISESATKPLRAVSDEGGRTGAELDADLAAQRDAAPMLTLCALCEWRFDGTAGEGRQAAREHRAERHPELVRGRRRRSGVNRWRRGLRDPDERAEAMAAVERRQRTTHA